MKHSSKIMLAVAVFVAGTAISHAQQPMKLADVLKPEDQGVMFTNGLSEAIAEGYAKRQEQCDVFLCDKWERIDYPDRVLGPSKSSVIAGIFVATGNAPRICNWALKIVMVSGVTHEFPAQDICVTNIRSQIAFRERDGKFVAIKAWKDSEGKLKTESVDAIGQ